MDTGYRNHANAGLRQRRARPILHEMFSRTFYHLAGCCPPTYHVRCGRSPPPQWHPTWGLPAPARACAPEVAHSECCAGDGLLHSHPEQASPTAAEPLTKRVACPFQRPLTSEQRTTSCRGSPQLSSGARRLSARPRPHLRHLWLWMPNLGQGRDQRGIAASHTATRHSPIHDQVRPSAVVCRHTRDRKPLDPKNGGMSLRAREGLIED